MNHLKNFMDGSVFHYDSFSRKQILESEIELLKSNKTISCNVVSMAFIYEVTDEYVKEHLPQVIEALELHNIQYQDD